MYPFQTRVVLVTFLVSEGAKTDSEERPLRDPGPEPEPGTDSTLEAQACTEEYKSVIGMLEWGGIGTNRNGQS